MEENNILLDKLIARREKHIETLLDEEFSGIWRYVKGNYSSEAHFVNELLQNADDCAASTVSFIVEKKGLWFKHNGSVRFTVSDVDKTKEDKANGKLGHINAITSIGNSNKVGEQKIGKFGIGFKAVFAYTDEPEIYDDHFCFKLNNYIVPERIKESNVERKTGETLFYFPFNSEDKSPEQAYSEIVNKLQSLRNPLLFLRNLKEIVWSSEKVKGSFKKKLHTQEDNIFNSEIQAQVFDIVAVSNNTRTPERIWLFSNAVYKEGSTYPHKIFVGLKLNPDGSINTTKNFDAFCFFPTKENTGLKFLLHAPFLLTDNRQSILAGNEWNKLLVQQLAKLSSQVLLIIKEESIKRKQSLFGQKFLDLIPYDPSYFEKVDSTERISFLPFYTEIQNLLGEEEILPGRDNIYFTKNNAYWAADKELLELLSDNQLSDILGYKRSGFVFPELGQKYAQQTNPQLYTYLRRSVADVITPDKIIRLITKNFIENQSIAWLLKFYEYLNDKPSYLAISKDYPIVLCENGKAVIPYDKNRLHYEVYLPSSNVSEFKSVHPDLYASDIGKQFFNNLGIAAPDIKAVFLSTVLKNYDKEEFDIDDLDFINHTKTLIDFYKSQDTSEFQTYVERISKLHLFRGLSSSEKNEAFLYRSIDLYKASSDLKEYFADNENIAFLDEKFYAEFLSAEELFKLHSILDLLKIQSVPKVKTKESYANSNMLLDFGLADYEDNYYKTIYDKELDGFDHFLENVSLSKSIAAWNTMIEFLRKNDGYSYTSYGLGGKFCYQKDGRHTVRNLQFESSALKSIRYSKWLYDIDGALCSPDKMLAENLSPSYEISTTAAQNLISFLRFVSLVADPSLSEDQQQIYDLGKLINKSGFSEAEVVEALNLLQKKNNSTNEDERTSPAIPIDNFAKDEPRVASKKKNVIKTVNDLTAELFEDISKNNTTQSEIVTPRYDNDEYDVPDNAGDYFPPIDLEEEYNKRVEEVKREIEELAIVQQLKNEVVENEKYSYGWFKALMELENLKSAESNSNSKEISISFSNAQIEEEDSRILLLSKPNRFIPQSIEEIGDLVLKVFEDGKPHSVSIEVVNVKEYTVRAKVRRKSDIAKINFNKVTKVVIDIKNPIFLLEELNKNLLEFAYEDDHNLKENLTKKIKFIFGPPGTGKTTYLATDEIIPFIKLNKELKILVLTPTNKSADVLTSRIIEKMDGNNSYLDWLIRFGPSDDQKITEELGEDFKNIDINEYGNAVVVSTIARYAYDFFQKIGSFHKEYIRFFPWDYIIIDEASMITLPNVVNVLYSQPQADFIIAGDPFQITPISQVPEWKEENIYTMVNLLSFSEPKTEPHNYEIINRYTQYRSVPAIGNLFSTFSYDGKLLHHRSENDKKKLDIPNLDLKDLNVIKFPVRKNESIFSPNSLNGSKYHIYSALFTVELVVKIATVITESNSEVFKIGVICPYKAQADIIEKIVSQQFVNNKKVEILVGTIHGFQGDQCDVIFTIFNPPYKIDGSPSMFLNNQNILNVAISRARDYLIILMPDENSPNVQNLKKVNQIANLCFVSGNKHCAEFTSQEIEKKLFGSNSYIFDNSFATSHQKVNVYSDPVKKYEVRCEDIAVDVQIRK